MIEQKSIRSRLAAGLVSEIQRVSGKLCIITPMYYPNGDSINVHFDSGKDGMFVTDEGETADNLHQRGIEMTPDRRVFVRSVCRARGALFLPPRITRPVKLRSLNDDVFSFCQAITDVAGLHYHNTNYRRSSFNETLDDVLRRKVQKSRNVERKWTHSILDPKGSFPVDYHIVTLRGTGPRNVFSVASEGKALLVTAVSHFLRSHGVDIPTLAIVDVKADLKDKQIDRLQYSSDEMVFGVKGNERKIVNFALGATR